MGMGSITITMVTKHSILALLFIRETSTAFTTPLKNNHISRRTSRQQGFLPQSISSTQSSNRAFNHVVSSLALYESNSDEMDSDWRAFRAKLVMDEQKSKSSSADDSSSSSSSPDDSLSDLDGIGAALQGGSSPLSTWAYESEKMIETGAVILGGVDSDFGFGLRQQYFHKVAILVLEHTPKFTKGVILNRPTDMFLDSSKEWRVWFGGDVQGLGSGMADVVCLHSLEDPLAQDVSTSVMKDIKCCSFEKAQSLVSDGVATASDFWVFCGYAGWGPGQLMGELERKSWYMVATDSQTLLKELARQGLTVDPRDAGLDTWELLMKMIGKAEKVELTRNGFDDLMLKEWARTKLCSEYSALVTRDKGTLGFLGSLGSSVFKQPLTTDSDKLPTKIKPGMILRASPQTRSPFLLSKQEFHKSLMLILNDDPTLTVAVILNQPAAKGLDLELVDKNTKKRILRTIPLRYGGEYAIKGNTPLLWLHCSDRLKENNVGTPLTDDGDDDDDQGIWKLTSEDATQAIAKGLATYRDFIIVSGVSVWAKMDDQRGGDNPFAAGIQNPFSAGIQEEIRKGVFEVVPNEKTNEVWNILKQQSLLTNSNLLSNLAIGNEAWKVAATDTDNDNAQTSSDDDIDDLVFKSDVQVSNLSDDALRSWVATFLLGAPGMYN